MSALELPEAAWHGHAGRLLSMVSGSTEADPVAILFGFLAGFGNVVGPGPYKMIGQDRHGTRVWPISVGETAKARKGHARTLVREILSKLDAEWFEHRNVSGHASGEGLVEDLTPQTSPDGIEEPVDPRLFVAEGEFSRVLKISARQGSTLSDQLRNAWDGLPIHNRKAQSRRVARTHHVTLVGDITRDELSDLLTQTDAVNGFGNRFLWIEVHRQGRHSRGGTIHPNQIDEFSRALRSTFLTARRVTDMDWTIQGGKVWDDWYLALEDRSGLVGSITSRNDAYALRLSMIYALLDGSSQIDVAHVEAGCQLSDYAASSAARIFGTSSGNRNVDKLVDHLAAVRGTGSDGRSLDRLFGGRSTVLAEARERAIQLGLAVEITEPSRNGGRPRRVLYGYDHAPAEEVTP